MNASQNSDGVILSCPCPPWPIAGPLVARELDALNVADFPHTVEWISRLDKHAAQHKALEGR